MPGQPRREEDTGLGDDGQQDARRRPASSGNRKTFPSPGVIPGEGKRLRRDASICFVIISRERESDYPHVILIQLMRG